MRQAFRLYQAGEREAQGKLRVTAAWRDVFQEVDL